MADATMRIGQTHARIREYFTHLAHFDPTGDLTLLVVNRHARAFLPAMLQSGQSQREIAPYIDLLVGPHSGSGVDSNYSTGVV